MTTSAPPQGDPLRGRRPTSPSFIEYAAGDRESLPYVRPPGEGEVVADGWRIIDLTVDRFEPTDESLHPWPDDRRALYWWSPDFWRPRADDRRPA
ncbi:hypothetical protein [Herbidospora yilanensis]|uniref:hypothetical protein n=1 Tax=Herbidospora yilanensis TaxID=354426 RepID=UPI0007843939|nr:hypothetical protein [Herbidospora yilanensis]